MNENGILIWVCALTTIIWAGIREFANLDLFNTFILGGLIICICIFIGLWIILKVKSGECWTAWEIVEALSTVYWTLGLISWISFVFVIFTYLNI